LPLLSKLLLLEYLLQSQLVSKPLHYTSANRDKEF